MTWFFEILCACAFAKSMKVKDIIKLIENDGWDLARINGSHRHYKHKSKKGIVTVPGKMSADLAIGTERSILKQAGLDK